jgi:hypothetical protein
VEQRIIRTREDVRDYINGLYIRGSGRDLPSVRRWRLAARATMGTALLYAALQYYFISVFIEIMSLPAITVFTGPIMIGVG